MFEIISNDLEPIERNPAGVLLTYRQVLPELKDISSLQFSCCTIFTHIHF